MWRALFLVCLFGCAAGAYDNDIGAKYIGAMYLSDPLGEAIAPDTDPLIRDDAFDCVTFVETVIANGDVDRLNKIRYANGIPNFIERNHFIETIPSRLISPNISAVITVYLSNNSKK